MSGVEVGTRTTGSAAVLTLAPAALAIATLAAQAPNPRQAAGRVPAARCAPASLAGALPNATTVVTAAMMNPATGPQPARGRGGPTPALPEHCEIVGKLDERTGIDGQSYAINFRLRLPADWNGRFFFQGGGGSNGTVGDALGALQGQQPTVALALGYAVVSQDSGHDNRTNANPQRGGIEAFGFDPQARVDFGYHSYGEVTRVAKAMIAAYYGRPAARSYYVGCSEGGREAMMVSQRFPDEFDGVLACSPGFRLPRAAVAEAWDSQAFAVVARGMGVVDANGQPLISAAFTDDDLLLVSRAVLASCDALDGAADGLIQRFTACTGPAVRPALAAATCLGAKTPSCLSSPQVAALEKVFGGARTSRGESLYAPWPWDAGIGGKTANAYNQGWRVWKLGAPGAPVNSALNLTLGASALPSVFVTPPVPVSMNDGGAAAYSLGFDMDVAPKALANTTDAYRQSALEFMKADSTDLAAFRGRGGRLILVHGVSDPVFSILDTVSWWDDVNRANGGRAAEFARLFAVPGMNHCGGGPSTDQFDAFGALVEWVEHGTAPDRIVATARASTPWPGRARPLCPYPKVARYKGTGSLESADSFACQ